MEQYTSMESLKNVENTRDYLTLTTIESYSLCVIDVFGTKMNTFAQLILPKITNSRHY